MTAALIEKATDSSGPWWAAPGSALVGIIVGFVLKAVFDWHMERQRRDREDRHRFVSEKMRAYADLGLLISDIMSLIERTHEWDRIRTDLDNRIMARVAEENEQPVDGEELDAWRAEVAAANAHLEGLKQQSAERVHEMSRLVNLLALIAPFHVQDAVSNLVDAVTTGDEDFDDARVDAMRAVFFAVAGEDVGRKPSAS